MLKNVFKRPAYYLASAAFIIISIVYIFAIIRMPYIGLELANVNDNWRVVSCDPHGEGYKLGIRAGDIILKINNVDTGNYCNAQIWSQAEGARTIEIKKMDKTNDTIIEIPRPPVSILLLSQIPMIILGIVFVFLGFLIWFKRPFLDQARSLFWLDLFIGLAIVIAPASSRDVLLAKNLEYITLSTVPILLINFFSIFPVHNNNRVNRYSRYILEILLFIITGLTILQSSRIVHYDNLLKKIVLLNFCIGILVALGNIGALIRLPNDKPEKNQAGILLWGMVIGFGPFIVMTAIPLIFNTQPLLYTEASYLFVSAIPVSWHYVIVNKYLPDSRKILGQVISFFIAGAISSLAGICILFFVGEFKYLNLEALLAWSALTIMVVVGFNLLRLLISKLLKKFGILTGEHNLSQRVLKLNERLTSLNEGEYILEEVINCMGIEGAYIVAENANGMYLKKAAGRFSENPDELARLETYFQADQRNNLGAQKLPDDFPAEFFTFIEYNGFDCGIFLGHRFSRTKLQQEDLPLIALISNQAAQCSLTTYVIKELSQEIKEISQKSLNYQRKIQRMQGITGSLFKGIEQERKSIARDIHDGPLQLALDLNRWLDEITEECSSVENGKAFKVIAHQREIIRNLNFELRSICSDLRPPSLSDLGLFSAIESLCEETMQNESIFISLETVGFNEEVSLREEIEITAYRFLQEGIVNAAKHSGSSEIKIKIELAESKFELSIRDYGKGFDNSKIDDLTLISEHFGLIGIKERLQSIGGELQVNSSISQGTIIIASIPIKGREMKNVIE